MLFQAMEKMQVVKDLYHSRHYSQCAKLGERLLAEAHDEMHPVHLAYLNFYTAISHDTLAREASLKQRYRELSLAEKHYVAAIAVLTPPETPKRDDDCLSSPGSERSWKRRSSNSGSFDSTVSTASSATSYTTETQDMEPELMPKPLRRPHYLPSSNQSGFHSRQSSRAMSRRSYLASTLSYRPQTPQGYQFSADTYEFVQAMQGHLASVRELKKKTDAPGVRFSFPSSQPPAPAAPKGRISLLIDEEEAEAIRKTRRSIKFRPRFDPTSVRRLCSDALWELS